MPNLLFDLTGSHKPRPDLGQTREAEKPTPVSRLDFEANHVRIGYKEPAEGRYTTLSRLTYKHGKDDESASVANATQLKIDARKRALENQQRNFSLPLDNQKKPQLVSEMHLAQQTSQEMLQTFQRRHKRGEAGLFENDRYTEAVLGMTTATKTNGSNNNSATRSAPRSFSPISSSSQTEIIGKKNFKLEKVYKHDEDVANIQQASDMKEHLIRMNATSIVEGAGQQQESQRRRERLETLQSTHRSSFQPRDSADAASQRKQQALELKKLQTKASATPIEDVPTRWASEVRSSFATKVTPNPPPLCTTAQRQHLKLDDAEGRELQRSGEALKSLYRADLRNFGKEASAASAAISWHNHQISLGSDDRKTAPSLYRASFTPTVFVTKDKGGAK